MTDMSQEELEWRIYDVIKSWPYPEGAGTVRKLIHDVLEARAMVLGDDTPTNGAQRNE